MIEFAIGFTAGLAPGFFIFRRIMRRYRKRYQEAMKWLDEKGKLPGEVPVNIASQGQKVGGLPPQGSSVQKPAEITIKQLVKLPFYTRRDLEIDRLKAGKPPRDPLDGLPPQAIKSIEEARLRYEDRWNRPQKV